MRSHIPAACSQFTRSVAVITAYLAAFYLEIKCGLNIYYFAMFCMNTSFVSIVIIS